MASSTYSQANNIKINWPKPSPVGGTVSGGTSTQLPGESYAAYLTRLRAESGNPLTLPAPPVGTYDQAIDYNAGAAQRGYGQTYNDAQTAFEQGQQDYGLGVGDLTRGRDRTLADLLTSNTRANIGYNNATADTVRQYGILGHQQAQNAARQGITSQGLLAKSASIRAQNQGLDQSRLDLQHGYDTEDYNRGVARTGEDFTRGKLGLDLGNARAFGGFNGTSILNPLTGQPEFGSLLTQLTRAGTENNAYQTAAAGQRASQAAAGGYQSPLTQPNGAQYGYIGKAPATAQQYQAGLPLEAMLRASARQQGKSYEEVARGAGIDPVTLRRIA